MIQTTVQNKFTVQRILLIVICLVMGLWGVYDYTVKIPGKTRAYERGQVCVQVAQGLDPNSTAEDRTRAVESVERALTKLWDLGIGDATAADDDQRAQTQQVLESIKARNEEAWLARLLLFRSGLEEAELRSSGASTTPRFDAAVQVARDGVNETAEISPPSKFDRATQWLFILCLPFVPIFTWSYLRAKSRTYRLDEEGTLHAPEGSWTKDEIADIDMCRWMAKSVCWVVHSDGRRIKLDDYVYLNTNRIAGAIASEMYPDQWDEEARQQKPESAGGGEAGRDDGDPTQSDEADEADAGAAIEDQRAQV